MGTGSIKSAAFQALREAGADGLDVLALVQAVQVGSSCLVQACVHMPLLTDSTCVMHCASTGMCLGHHNQAPGCMHASGVDRGQYLCHRSLMAGPHVFVLADLGLMGMMIGTEVLA